MVSVYHTDTGFTREYAMLLSRAEGVRICSLEEAGYQLQPGERVLFLGPLMAGTIKGLKKARQLCEVVGVCGVGMSPPGPQVLEALKQKNGTGELPLFYLQGGWAPDRVGRVKRYMVGLATRSIRRALEEKGDNRTPEEQAQLEFLISGGSFVRPEHLAEIRAWMHAVEAPE